MAVLNLNEIIFIKVALGSKEHIKEKNQNFGFIETLLMKAMKFAGSQI